MVDAAAREALAGLKEAGIDFVSGLPDGWQRNLQELIEADPALRFVPVCNEGVGFSSCAGAWLGGRKVALSMENSGLRVAAEYIARISLGCGVPVVLLPSYRGDLGETEHWGVPHGIVAEPLLRALRIVVARFVRASMAGWKQYLADPSAANALIKQENPRAADDQLAYALGKLKELRALTGGDAERLGIGTMSDARYKEIYEPMVREGLLKPEVDYRQAFTTQFVKDLRVMP